MSQEGYLARLGIDTSDMDSAIQKAVGFLAELGDSFDGLSKVTDRAEAGLLKVASGGKTAATGVKSANTAATEGTGEWQKYVKALDDANKAYRSFKQGQVTREGGGLDIPTSRAEQDKLLETDEAQRASIISAIKEQRREEASAARERTAALDRDIADSERLRQAQQKRINDIRMAERLAANERRQAAMAQNALAASAFRAGGIDSRLGQEPTGQRAADTGFAALLRAQERQAGAIQEGRLAKRASETTRLVAAERSLAQASAALADAQTRVNQAMKGNDLREQVRATEAAADAQQAQTLAMRESIAAREAENAALSRTRYALYDVSQVAAITGAAMLATTVAIAGSAVAYEREFANVRRTVGVTGEAADDLYSSFLRMSTQIPTSFADLSSIGTLAGQLGVAEGRVSSFTQTVAQFAATTDVTVDASATAFGRLDQLLDGVNGQYDRLGSSILNVGINSVATESQIITVASQIAAAGQQSGLAASEVIGLSAALASLGIAPEAARGTILRVFSQINGAIAQGGDNLERYAALAGMSAEQFKQGWSSDFTGTFLAWLNGVQSSAAGAETTIRDLGITAVRDVNALLRLAQNGDVLSESLDLAAQGFEDTGILAANFGIIAETNAAKIQVLGQSVLAFFATLGAGTSGPLSDFLDRLQSVTEGLIRMAETPVGQFVGGAIVSITALVGVMGLLTAVTLRGVGSWMAIRTAMGSATAQSWLAAGGIKAVAASLLGASGAAGAFGAALKATGVGLLITGGLWVLGEAVGAIASEMRTGAQVAEDYLGTIEGLGAAIAADNPQLVADAVREQGTAARESSAGFDELVLSIANQRVETERMQAAIAAGNQSLAAQTFTVGENTRAWIQNQLMQSEAFTKMFENASQLQALMGTSFTGGGVTVDHTAFSLEAYIDAASTGGQAAADAYYNAWYNGLVQAFDEAGAIGGGDGAIFEALGGNEALTQVREMGEAVAGVVQEGQTLAAAGDMARYVTDSLLGTADAGFMAADGLDAAGTGAWITAQEVSTLIDAAWGADNAARILGDSMYRLGAEFAQGGATAAISSEAMQQVVQNIISASGSAPIAAANMQGFFNMLVEGGYASASQLAQLQSVIAGLTGGQAITVAVPKFNPAAFNAGLASVQKKAAGRGGKGQKGGGGGAAGAVRTLVDYANDLQKVMSRSFDIRFGSQQSMDKITTSWRDLREETDAARETIVDATQEMNEALREHQATAQGLLSDRAIATYWLEVAEAYGDALRAGELRAELAEIDDELAKSSEDSADAQRKGAETIADAQKTLDKGLTGTGEAAIENRAKILELVSGYQDYITELASSGMSQADLQAKSAQLKDEFIRQATQLGYNSSELGVYASAFDDVRVAIDRVPRNITVTANTNPGLQALNEFVAQSEKKGREAGAAAANGFGSGYGGVTVAPPTFLPTGAENAGANAGSAWKRGFQRGANGAFLYSDGTGAMAQTGVMRFMRGGGFTGYGNEGKIAGYTHGNEYVMPASATRAIGVPMLNHMRATGTVPTVATGGGGGVMELSPHDRMLLEQIRDASGITIGDEVLGRHVTAANVSSSRRGQIA